MRVRLIRYSFIVGILLLTALPVFAQDTPAGRTVVKQDWIDFMPVVIGSIIVVIVVDAFFLLPIFKKKNTENKENQA